MVSGDFRDVSAKGLCSNFLENEIFDPNTYYLVYDGDCPFCSRFVTLVRFKKAVGAVELVDARSDRGVVDCLRGRGIDLDEGMALVFGGRIYHGDACLQRLAMMSTSSDLFNRFNGWVFRSSLRSRLLYPWLRFARNCALWFLGRGKIG